MPCGFVNIVVLVSCRNNDVFYGQNGSSTATYVCQRWFKRWFVAVGSVIVTST